jgi:hypothetical protein
MGELRLATQGEPKPSETHEGKGAGRKVRLLSATRCRDCLVASRAALFSTIRLSTVRVTPRQEIP